jgi:hypothetical protein
LPRKLCRRVGRTKLKKRWAATVRHSLGDNWLHNG